MMIGDVKRLCAQFYGMSRPEIEGLQRARRFARPRQVAMTMCRHFTRQSSPQIGRAFGGRDHTTVLWACKKLHSVCAYDPDFASEIALLCAQIEAGEITLVSAWALRERAKSARMPVEAPRQPEPTTPTPCQIFADRLARASHLTALRDPVFIPRRDTRSLSGPRLLLRGPDSLQGAGGA